MPVTPDPETHTALSPARGGAPVRAMPGRAETDAALVARISAGRDRAALADLALHYGPRLKGWLMNRGEQAATAEDIVQDVMVTVWLKAGQFDVTRGGFSTWLYRVVFNRCLDVKRRRRETALNPEDDRPDESEDAVATIHQGQIAERLREAMSELPEPQYMALMMYYHEGYNAREVAELMETSTNAVESLLKRGRQNLRQYLKRLKVDARQAFNDS